jgi:phosphoglycerate dehydrogenase-like enzyme
MPQNSDMSSQETIVLFTWEVIDRLKDYLITNLDDLPNLKLIFLDPVSDENLLQLAPTADIVVGWRVKDEIKLAATKMKLFINPGAGIRHHLEFFRELNRTRSVSLINGHGNSYFTAQHVIALLLSLMNKIIQHHNWMKDGQWRKGDKDAITLPLRYKKVGLLGYGHINKLVHKFLQGFDIEFAILRRNWPSHTVSIPTNVKRYTPSELSSFLEYCDIIIIAVPETSQTIGLIGKDELQRFRGGILVNISRGSVVEEKSLYDALKNKEIDGAAIDVWYEYKPTPDNSGKKYPFHYPFHLLDNVVLSPHRGASPLNDLQRWDEVIENIKRFHRGEDEFLNVIDLNREY